MAQSPPKKPRRTRPRTGCFPGCFGRRHPDEAAQFKTRPNDGGRAEKLKISWFYWSHFRVEKSAAKTVPFETGAALVSSTVEAEKKEANDRFNNPQVKSKSKSKPKPDRIASKSRPAKEATTTAAEAAPLARPPESEGDRETSEHEPEAHRNDARENRTDSTRGNTWHNQKRVSFRRKLDAIRAASSQPGSPDVKPAKPSRSSTAAVIPHSASLPNLDPEPQPPPTAAPPRPVQPQKNRKARSATGPSGDGRRVDPLVGMSIITVTLVIMMLWGRLCAILCTAVWFYFVPRLRSATQRPVNGEGPNSNPNGPDLNSEEHKKRVVLEGLLERTRRGPP